MAVGSTGMGHPLSEASLGASSGPLVSGASRVCAWLCTSFSTGLSKADAGHPACSSSASHARVRSRAVQGLLPCMVICLARAPAVQVSLLCSLPGFAVALYLGGAMPSCGSFYSANACSWCYACIFLVAGLQSRWIFSGSFLSVTQSCTFPSALAPQFMALLFCPGGGGSAASPAWGGRIGRLRGCIPGLMLSWMRISHSHLCIRSFCEVC